MVYLFEFYIIYDLDDEDEYSDGELGNIDRPKTPKPYRWASTAN